MNMADFPEAGDRNWAQPLVAGLQEYARDTIASTPTVVAAAANAVAGALADADIPTAEQVPSTDGWIFALIHEENREVALGKRTNGTWYPPELNAAIADQVVGLTSDDSGWKIAAYYEDTKEVAWGLRTNGTWYPATLGGGPSASPGITIHGDSITANWAPYVADLAALLGVPVRAVGNGGHRSGWIAARQGGQPLRIAVNGGTIPASGAVNVAIVFATQVGTTAALMAEGTYSGVLGGVAGTLTITANGTGTFTRSNAGRPTPVPPATPFVTGLTSRTTWPIFWAGRNNFKLSGDVQQIINDTRRMASWTENRERGLVFGILPWADEPNGSPERATLDAANAALRDEFPTMFEDIGARLRSTDMLAAVGINPTATDLDDISKGVTPTSLRSDIGHPNAVGYRAINLIVTEIYKSRGWLS